MNHPTYNPSSCCMSPCFAEQEDTPCWGDVQVIDEITYDDDWVWIHACEGHAEIWCGGAYLPPGQPFLPP